MPSSLFSSQAIPADTERCDFPLGEIRGPLVIATQAHVAKIDSSQTFTALNYWPTHSTISAGTLSSSHTFTLPSSPSTEADLQGLRIDTSPKREATFLYQAAHPHPSYARSPPA